MGGRVISRLFLKLKLTIYGIQLTRFNPALRLTLDRFSVASDDRTLAAELDRLQQAVAFQDAAWSGRVLADSLRRARSIEPTRPGEITAGMDARALALLKPDLKLVAAEI